jgi:hypothetical protein
LGRFCRERPQPGANVIQANDLGEFKEAMQKGQMLNRTTVVVVGAERE